MLGWLVGCGSGDDDTDAAVRQGNAAHIRGDFEAADPQRAATLADVVAAEVRAMNQAPKAQQVPGSDRTPLVPAGTEALVAMRKFADEALMQINATRARARLCGEQPMPAAAALRWNVRAAYAALLEVEWMQQSNTFGHQWPSGGYVWDRLMMAGYDWELADENIAAGFRSLAAAMQAWIESPSHCTALMGAGVTDVGLAVVPGTGSNNYLSYWAMVLARPRVP